MPPETYTACHDCKADTAPTLHTPHPHTWTEALGEKAGEGAQTVLLPVASEQNREHPPCPARCSAVQPFRSFDFHRALEEGTSLHFPGGGTEAQKE